MLVNHVPVGIDGCGLAAELDNIIHPCGQPLFKGNVSGNNNLPHVLGRFVPTQSGPGLVQLVKSLAFLNLLTDTRIDTEVQIYVILLAFVIARYVAFSSSV